MAVTNNGKYRRLSLTINRKLNGSLVTTDGFPKVHNITDSFGSFAAITTANLELLPDGQYNTRLNAFYAHLESLYNFFDRSNVLNPSNGTDAVACPLDNSVPEGIIVTSYGASLAPVTSSMDSDHIEWSIFVSSPVTQDTPYEFQVAIKDRVGNTLRIEYLSGIIGIGQYGHVSINHDLFIYVPEVYNPSYSPISLETVPNSLQI